jgi:hypothetical protein
MEVGVPLLRQSINNIKRKRKKRKKRRGDLMLKA